MFNGVDVTFNLRNAKGITFSGGTSTGKVENNWCDIRAAVPENFLLNPYCNVSSPWQTSFRSLVAYTIPRIDVQLSSVFQDKPNVGTEQLGSLAANYTLTAADQAAAAAQIGRPLTTTGPITVNLLAGGQVYGPRVRQWDLAVKKIIRFGGQRLTVGADFYNLLNNNVTLGFSRSVRAERARLAVADDVHEPARVPSERRVRLLNRFDRNPSARGRIPVASATRLLPQAQPGALAASARRLYDRCEGVLADC